MGAKGGFPLSRNSSVRAKVIFTRINNIEAKYSKSREHVKVEHRLTFTFKCYLSCIASIISFARVKFTFVRRTEKLLDSGNPVHLFSGHGESKYRLFLGKHTIKALFISYSTLNIFTRYFKQTCWWRINTTVCKKPSICKYFESEYNTSIYTECTLKKTLSRFHLRWYLSVLIHEDGSNNLRN